MATPSPIAVVLNSSRSSMAFLYSSLSDKFPLLSTKSTNSSTTFNFSLDVKLSFTDFLSIKSTILFLYLLSILISFINSSIKSLLAKSDEKAVALPLAAPNLKASS